MLRTWVSTVSRDGSGKRDLGVVAGLAPYLHSAARLGGVVAEVFDRECALVIFEQLNDAVGGSARRIAGIDAPN